MFSPHKQAWVQSKDGNLWVCEDIQGTTDSWETIYNRLVGDFTYVYEQDPEPMLYVLDPSEVAVKINVNEIRRITADMLADADLEGGE